jgi:hypothetical protein
MDLRGFSFLTLSLEVPARKKRGDASEMTLP